MHEEQIECESNVFKSFENVILDFKQDELLIRSRLTKKCITIHDNHLGGCSIESRSQSTNEQKYISVLYFQETISKGQITNKIKTFEISCTDEAQTERICSLIRYKALPSKLKIAEHEKKGINEARAIYVIINPECGSKTSVSIFRNEVAPYLKYGNFTATEVISNSNEHLLDVSEKILELSEDIIMVVGGDGTFHNVLNGLYRQKLDDKHIDKSFILIPAGSGNALVASVLQQSNLTFCIENCIYSLLKGCPDKLCASEVNVSFLSGERSGQAQSILSFLNLTWGTIADVDIESECCKFMGKHRFIPFAIKNILIRKKRKVKVFFKPSEEKDSPDSNDDIDFSLLGSEEGENYRTVFISQVKCLTSSIVISEKINLGFSGYILGVIRGHASAIQIARCLCTTAFHDLYQEERSKSKDENLWLDIREIRGFKMETDGGKLVIDGEFIFEGKFSLTMKILPYQFNYISIT
ncbi:Sphingosine kinase 1 [Thelohanellus kitauei]|uniref:Sphingosine kinase 1 n=1 Tax=Thelohanellus kitauei TaxID=669202 RepID=A0A0C2MU92_THEKT|nr:Sphingosine kinase 1 [Thelohanellus kitauei]